MRALNEIPSLDAQCALNGQANKGVRHDPLREKQRIIEADKNDLFDLLAYVTFALQVETRATRTERASPQRHDRRPKTTSVFGLHAGPAR